VSIECDLPLKPGDVGLYVVKCESGLYRAGIAGTRGKADLLSRLKLHGRKTPAPGNMTTLNRPWKCIWRHVLLQASPLRLLMAEHLLMGRLIEVGEFRHCSIFAADNDEVVIAAARSAIPLFNRITVGDG
jgi:hypothetical protein